LEMTVSEAADPYIFPCGRYNEFFYSLQLTCINNSFSVEIINEGCTFSSASYSGLLVVYIYQVNSLRALFRIAENRVYFSVSKLDILFECRHLHSPLLFAPFAPDWLSEVFP